MTKVTFTENGKILSLRVEGHAGYAEHGTDIVCASASILAYTVAKIVSDALSKGWLKIPPIIEMDSGLMRIVCEPIEEQHSEIRHTYMVAREGYALLEQNYPQYVRLMP
jgi:uncharacterized protein YsxB (DUF464 family)